MPENQTPTADEREPQRVTAAIEALDWAAHQDRRRLAKAQAEVVDDVQRGRFPTWSALEALAVTTRAVCLWDSADRMHAAPVQHALDSGTTPPARLAVLREEADRLLDYTTRYPRLGGSTSPAENLRQQGQTVADLTWGRQVLDMLAALAEAR